MKTPINYEDGKVYDYVYTSSEHEHHHDYLMPTLLKLVNSISEQGTKQLSILDIGCGSGSICGFLSRLDHSVTGIENSKSGLEYAKAAYKNCEFIEASVYDVPRLGLDQKFDVVLSVEVIEHLFYPRELVRAAKTCLKPNGMLILTTPYHGYMKNFLIALMGKSDQHFNPLWDGGHIKFFSPQTLEELLQEEGILDIKADFVGRLPFLWKSMIFSGKV